MKVPAALVVIPLILVAFYLWWLLGYWLYGLGDWLHSKIKPHVEAWLWRRINRKKEDS